MTLRKFVALSVVVAACAVLFSLMVPDAFAAAVPVVAGGMFPHAGAYSAAVVLAVGLDALRAQRKELADKAAAKIAEVKDGMPADQVRTIETDHAEIVRDIATVDGAIAVEERHATPPKPAASAADAAAERARAAEITTLSARHAMPVDFAARHIADNTSIEEVRRLVLDHVANSAARIAPRVEIGREEQQTLRDAVEMAVLNRANPGKFKIENGHPAGNYRGMRLLEMGRVFIEETTGERLRNMGVMELATRVLGLNDGLRSGAAMSTSDFPSILANVVNKRLRDAYAVAPQNWKQLGRQSNAPDFKQKAVTQLSNLPNLLKIKEGGEYTFAQLADSQEVYSLATYGRKVLITRQTLINDDLGAFDRLPMLFGRAAAETEAGIFWGIITANAAMSDTIALFHASHGNLGTAAAIAIASLNEARSSMRKQKGLAKKAADAEPLNLMPKFLVVSPDKETEAQQFLATTLYPNQNSQVNPFAGSMTQITEARLSGNAWYVWADPATIDTIEYAYLEGEDGLYTEQRLGFDVDGLEIKGRLDFAAKAIDWRGMFKNPGA